MNIKNIILILLFSISSFSYEDKCIIGSFNIKKTKIIEYCYYKHIILFIEKNNFLVYTNLYCNCKESK